MFQGYSFLLHKYRVVFSAWKASYYIKYRPVLIRLFARLCMTHSISLLLPFLRRFTPSLLTQKFFFSYSYWLPTSKLQIRRRKEEASAEYMLQSNWSSTTIACNKSNAFFTQAQMRNSVVLQIRLWKENVVVDWQQEII